MNARPILGGTFDPVHLGHIRAALAGGVALGASSVTLLLAARPWHRAAPQASAAARAAMLRLAVGDANAAGAEGSPPAPTLLASEHEGAREGPSYTVSTLTELAGPAPIVWLLGDDAVAGIGSWHRADELAGLCNLLVFARAASATSGKPGKSGETPAPPPGFRPVAHPAALRRRRCGLVHYLDAEMMDVSATDARARIARQEDARALLPQPVWAYIRRRGLYGAATTPCAPAAS